MIETAAPAAPRLRHVYVVEGRALGDYVERPKDQVAAICRKHGGYSIPLWRYLVNAGKVRVQTQRLDPVTRTWRQI